MADTERLTDVLQFGREILHDEARALDALADSLGEPFERAVGLILDCPGKLIVSGLGKSGHVARKIAATFASTGTTATFLHLAEAIHGLVSHMRTEQQMIRDWADGQAAQGREVQRLLERIAGEEPKDDLRKTAG